MCKPETFLPLNEEKGGKRFPKKRKKENPIETGPINSFRKKIEKKGKGTEITGGQKGPIV